MTRRRRSAMTKKPVPMSPWRAMTWPSGKSTSTVRSAIRLQAVRVHAVEQPAPTPAARSAGLGSGSCVLPVGRSAAWPPRRSSAGDDAAPPCGERQGLRRANRDSARRDGRARGTMRAWPTERNWSTRSPGFGLFADLTVAAARAGIVHTFEEMAFAEGERILRQGLSGSGFHVILDGEAAVVVDGTERARLGRGDFFGEVSILLGRGAHRGHRRDPADALPRARRPGGRGVPRRPPAGHVPDAPGAGPAPARREPMAELTDRPGSIDRSRRATTRSSSSAPGPARSRSRTRCGRLGVAHAVVSADPSPGGMFRRWPFFQRLLSWTKPHAPVARGSRAYERYDWNSLLGETPETRAIQPGLMDGSSYFPSRPGDGGQPRRRSRSGPGSTSATTAAGPGRADGGDGRRSALRRRDDGRRVPCRGR